jgi:hypothetical protein
LDCEHTANTGPVPSHYSPESKASDVPSFVQPGGRRRGVKREHQSASTSAWPTPSEAQAAFPPISRDPAGKFQILFKLIVSPAGRCPRDGSANSHVALTKSPMRKLILIIPAALTPANISGPTGR